MIEVLPELVHDDGEPGCEYGLCRRVAEVAVTLVPGDSAWNVCQLHLWPVISWGTVAQYAPRLDAINTLPDDCAA